MTVAEARRLTGLGLTTIWALIGKKELESVLVGRRRLIVFASLRRLLTPNDNNQMMQERSAAARRLRGKRSKEKATSHAESEADDRCAPPRKTRSLVAP